MLVYRGLQSLPISSGLILVGIGLSDDLSDVDLVSRAYIEKGDALRIEGIHFLFIISK